MDAAAAAAASRLVLRVVVEAKIIQSIEFQAKTIGFLDARRSLGSVGESNRFGCCGFSCADLRCKFKLHLIEGG